MFSTLSTTTYTVLTALILYALFTWFKKRSAMSGLKLPPGPPRRFLIGNLLDMPRQEEWLTYHRWAKEYGDLVYVTTLGTSILYVNSREMAQEIFEKRGNIYSKRYRSTVLHDLIKIDWIFTLQSPDEKWRRYKACFTRFFNQNVIHNYQDLQTKYVRTLLHRLQQSPNDFREHVRFVIGSLILEIAYGIQPRSENEPLLVLSEKTLVEVGEACLPGTYLVDFLPVLRHVPSWFPGANFKIALEKLRKQAFEMANFPINAIKEAMKVGNAPPSIATSLIEQFAADDATRPSDYEDMIKYVPGTAYFAGIDSTHCAIVDFFLAMVLNPQVQRKAQAELDKVVGSDGLPSFQDRQNLPYIEAVVKEALRWNATTSIGFPLVLSVDDVIGGYFVPKGTLVTPNTWTMLRSTSVYGEDADKFRPERFLQESGEDVAIPTLDQAFGYGRRACPGRHLAESTLFLLVASVLQVYDILPVESELPKEAFDSGLLLRAKPFKCRIVPRTKKAVKLLEDLSHEIDFFPK